MRVIYQKEDVMELIPELEGLILTHRNEVGAFDKGKFSLDPEWGIYKIFQDSGCYKLYTARNENNFLVGYIGFILQVMLHYKHNIIASNDLIFVHPSYRKGLVGYKLIKYAIAELKTEQVFGRPIDCISLTMKTKHPFDAIALRLGFKQTDKLFHMEV